MITWHPDSLRELRKRLAKLNADMPTAEIIGGSGISHDYKTENIGIKDGYPVILPTGKVEIRINVIIRGYKNG